MIHYELYLAKIQETWYYKVIRTSLEKILFSSIDIPFNPIYILLYINHCHIGFFGRFSQIRIVKGIYFHSHIVFFCSLHVCILLCIFMYMYMCNMNCIILSFPLHGLYYNKFLYISIYHIFCISRKWLSPIIWSKIETKLMISLRSFTW